MSRQPTEEWRSIPGTEGHYEASSEGRIRSLPREETLPKGTRHRRGRNLKIDAIGSSGYYQVGIRKDGVVRKLSVHRLVCEAFHGPCPPSHEVRHLNDVKTDNRAENLSWGTKRQNSSDQLANGTNPRAAKTECKWGHPFTPENTKVGRNGWRWCRTCHREDARRRKQRGCAA